MADLAGVLLRRLDPVYLVFGEEPLQLGEAVAAIRAAARTRGFADWELFCAQPGFEWSAVRDAAATLPLFGGARVLDVRLSDKPDAEAADFFTEYADRPSPDCLLLVSAGKLAADEQRKAWFQAIERAGAVVQTRHLMGRDLLQWLDRRLSAKGLLAEQAGLALLAARVEGNLLAAAQEIEKLHILYGPGRLGEEQIVAAVADSARFDVFDLVDAVLIGRVARAKRILDSLGAEGTAPAVVLWALARETRTLASLIHSMASGKSFEQACTRLPGKVFGNRKAALAQAVVRIDLAQAHAILLRCAAVDRTIKGEDAGDPWEGLLGVVTAYCGLPARQTH